MSRSICGARGYPGSNTPRMTCGQCDAKDAALAALREEVDKIGECLSTATRCRIKAESEREALRAELADLKDGLTAAHMDGFASGKAEATEMLRKREGQLEELRAEVKAYREVEDSLQKEIKRLDAEAERLKDLENKMGSGWALVEYEKVQARAEQAEREVERLKTASLDLVERNTTLIYDVAFEKKENTALRTRLEQAEKELAAERGKVEKQYELIDFYDAKVAAVIKWKKFVDDCNPKPPFLEHQLAALEQILK